MILWTAANQSSTARRVTEPVSLHRESLDAAAERNSPRVVPVRPGRGAVAALLVPESVAVRRNGAPVPSGAHALLHADCLDVDGVRYWVAAAAEIAVSQYDPATHGEGLYCFFTKARLKDGEAIVVCPGRPGSECSVIYKQAAWEMAIKADVKFQCPRCGFDPAAGDWQPSLPKPSQLPKLFELAALHRGKGGA